MTHGVGNDFLDLCAAIAQFCQCRWDRTVDDFEISSARKLFEFHQGEIWFDPCCVTVHDQPDCAGWRNHRYLRVTIAVLFTQC